MKTSVAHIVSLILLLVFNSLILTAQPAVKATADKTSIRTGEPVNVSLKATWPGRSTAISSFTIPDSLPHFDIWEKKNPLIIKDGIEQQLTLTSYDSGKFTIPEFVLTVTDSSGVSGIIHTDSFQVSVSPVNVDTLTEYHDIKDIIGVPPIPQWPYVAGIAAVTLVSLLAVYLLLQKLKLTKQENLRPAPRANPYLSAIRELDKLETIIETASNRTVPGYSKPFFTQLTYVYRTYLQDAYQFSSHQQTGDELILQAKSLLDQDLFFQLAGTIRLSDAAKFAKYDPPVDDWSGSIKVIRNSINLLDEKTHELQPNHNQ